MYSIACISADFKGNNNNTFGQKQTRNDFKSTMNENLFYNNQRIYCIFPLFCKTSF